MTNDKNKQKIYSRRFYRKNRDRLSCKQKDYYEQFSNRVRENTRNWQRKNPEKVSYLQWKRRWQDKLDVVFMLGGRCEKCGETDIRVLQVNHKNGGGGKEIRGVGSSNNMYRLIKKGRDISDLNILCANCNLRYEYTRGMRGKYLKFNSRGEYEIVIPQGVNFIKSKDTFRVGYPKDKKYPRFEQYPLLIYSEEATA